jgi:hypothetical protein
MMNRYFDKKIRRRVCRSRYFFDKAPYTLFVFFFCVYQSRYIKENLLLIFVPWYKDRLRPWGPKGPCKAVSTHSREPSTDVD